MHVSGKTANRSVFTEFAKRKPHISAATVKHNQGQKVEMVLRNLKSITTYGGTYENAFWVVTFTAAQVVGRVHVTRSFYTQFTFLACHEQLARALACLGMAGAVETPCWIAATLLTPRHRVDTREGRSHAHVITSATYRVLLHLTCQVSNQKLSADLIAQWKICAFTRSHSTWHGWDEMRWDEMRRLHTYTLKRGIYRCSHTV